MAPFTLMTMQKAIAKIIDESKARPLTDSLLRLENLCRGEDSTNLLTTAKAIVHFNTGDYVGAEHYARLALSLEVSPGVLEVLVRILQARGEHRSAIPYARNLFELTNSQQHRIQLIACLLDSANVREAHPLVIDGLAEEPESLKLVQANLACLKQQGLISEAMDVLDKLPTRFQREPSLLRLRADIVGEKDSLAAIDIYRGIIKSHKGSERSLNPVKWNMSLHMLRARQFELGYQYYEAGLTPEVGTMGRNLHPLIKRLPSLGAKSVDKSSWTVLTVEQGLGDQVMFLSTINDAVDEFSRVILLCEPRTFDLYERSFPRVQVATPGLIETLHDSKIAINGVLPIGSLLARYRPTIESFTRARRPFLSIARKKYNQYREILKAEAKGKTIVGISWKGGYWENQQRNKTIEIEKWLPVFDTGAYVVNLQYGDTTEDVEFLKSKGYDIRCFSEVDFKLDIDTWVTIAGACDGLISVSTALVHFAGAANQKIGLVMPERQGPFIWGLDEARSIVYPNVHIFRRDTDESMLELIRRVSRIVGSE